MHVDIVLLDELLALAAPDVRLGLIVDNDEFDRAAEPGLPTASAASLHEDPTGALWAGSDLGLAVRRGPANRTHRRTSQACKRNKTAVYGQHVPYLRSWTAASVRQSPP